MQIVTPRGAKQTLRTWSSVQRSIAHTAAGDGVGSSRSRADLSPHGSNDGSRSGIDHA